ncbi:MULTISPECIES: tyrosine-type recombinase/integrase [unclassified Brevundimonas]|uniref:tyrosine-type recombinase/integrase n=1 Tax=unclassified Brevundimonas TaxID=2622653 RepID=UPI0025C23CF2|nr:MULTISPECIES: tyrosine-type recombinase/integrase [unclassified Brevundimonas]
MKVRELLRYCELHEWRGLRSKATLRTNIKHLTALIGDDDIASLHYTRLKTLASQLESHGRKASAPSTVKRKLDTLSNALTIATRMTNDDGSPVLKAKPTFPTFEINNIQERTISDAELADMFEVIAARCEAEPHRDWTRFDAFMRFLLATACRRGEALRVWPGHIEQRDARHFVIFERYTTKSKKPRIVPLSAEIVRLLPALRLQAGNGPLFPFTASVLWGMWKAVRQDMAGRGHDFSLVRYHSTRHTTLTKAMKRYPIALVSKLAGHASIQITADRYGHLSADDLVGMVDEIAA